MDKQVVVWVWISTRGYVEDIIKTNVPPGFSLARGAGGAFESVQKAGAVQTWLELLHLQTRGHYSEAE